MSSYPKNISFILAEGEAQVRSTPGVFIYFERCVNTMGYYYRVYDEDSTCTMSENQFLKRYEKTSNMPLSKPDKIVLPSIKERI